MTLAVTAGAAVMILGCALLGALRDLPRGILVLTGVLFGAALVTFWAEPFASDLSRRFGNPDLALLRRFASIAIFAAATLLLGFGSGLLLPRVAAPSLATRLGGALLGGFTGALIAGFVLTYASYQNSPFLAQVRASTAGALLHDSLPLMLAASAALIAAAVMVVGVLRLLRGRPGGAPAARAKGAPSPQANRATDQVISDKIKERIG